MSTLEGMRRDYGKNALREEDVDRDPMRQFQRWFADAVASNTGEWFEPNAMTLATATKSGEPSARIVLLKEADERGFVYYGNLRSQKGVEMAENPRACLLFYWASQERQVRVNGGVERVSREEAEAYFRKRPRGNQLGAAASAQSRPVPSRRFLEERFAELDKLYGSDESLPLPEEWGGWRLTPDRFEFWQGQASRLHDRLVYTPGGAGRIGGDGWRIERLAP